jgi:hypothetical protein
MKEAEQNFDSYPERMKSPLHQVNSNNYNISGNMMSPKSYNAIMKREVRETNNINTMNYVDLQAIKKKNKEV